MSILMQSDRKKKLKKFLHFISILYVVVLGWCLYMNYIYIIFGFASAWMRVLHDVKLCFAQRSNDKLDTELLKAGDFFFVRVVVSYRCNV